MPFGNGTGPAGLGPMTGRAAGYCAGFGMPGYMNAAGRRGFGGFFGMGRGRGGGRGWRNRFHATGLVGWQRAAMGSPAWDAGWPFPAGAAMPFAPPTREQQLDMLKAQAANLEEALAEVRKQVQELQDAAQKQEPGTGNV